jgi:hypothetical protein
VSASPAKPEGRFVKTLLDPEVNRLLNSLRVTRWADVSDAELEQLERDGRRISEAARNERLRRHNESVLKGD